MSESLTLSQTYQDQNQTIDLSSMYTPTKKQSEGHVAKERYTFFGGARGPGKTTWLCTEMRQLLLEFPGNVGFIGRWESTTFTRTTLVTLMQYLPKDIILKHSIYEKYIELYNGSILYYGGLKPTQASAPIDKFKSFPLGCFAIDEATEVPEDIFLVLAGCLRLVLPGIRYRGLLASNPERGWVKDRFVTGNLPDHKFIKALPKDNPFLPSDYEEKLRELYPPEWVKKYIEGDWDFSIEDSFVFSYHLLDAAVNNDLMPSGKKVISVDFARGGEDETVIALCYENGYNEILWRCAYTPDLMPVVARVGNYIEQYQPSQVVGDGVGMGGPALDRLVEIYCPLESPQDQEFIVYFIGGSTANNSDRYANKRAESYWEFRLKAERGLVNLPKDEDIIKQGSSIRYRSKSDRQIQIESKKDSKSKSPDLIDALTMGQSLFGVGEEVREVGRVIRFDDNRKVIKNEIREKERDFRIGFVY